MITLIPRARVLAERPLLARGVLAYQDALDPSRDGAMDDEDDGAWFDRFRDDAAHPLGAHAIESRIVRLEISALGAYPGALAKALRRVSEALGEGRMTFVLAGRSQRWPTRRRTPAVLGEAARRLREVGAGGGFNGGISVDGDSFAEVVPALFWHARMEPGYGPVFFGPDDAPLTGTFCQYGNLHLQMYDEDAVARTDAALAAAGFVDVGDAGCREVFSADGSIAGRELRI